MTPNEEEIIIPVIFEREIGQEGKNSQVYLASEKHTQRKLVIKKIERKNLTINYFEEAKYLYKNKHPHIVELSYAGESCCRKYIYLAMPYYSKGSLNKLYDQGATTKKIIVYALEFLSGLHSMHLKKCIHLDLKADNILISDNDEALISDFGLVQDINFEGLGELVKGKGLFNLLFPPENLKNRHPLTSIYADIYQVGVILYSLLNQKKIEEYLKEHKNNGHTDIIPLIINGQFYDTSEFSYHIPKAIRNIVSKCLSTDPNDRPISVQDLINSLTNIQDDDSLYWHYKRKNQDQYWSNDKLNISCSLINQEVEIKNNKTNQLIYKGPYLQKLLDLLK